MSVDPYITPLPDWIVDMQVYSVVSGLIYVYCWQASEGVHVACLFNLSETRPTSEFPLPTSTVTQPNGATSSSTTSGAAAYNQCRVLSIIIYIATAVEFSALGR